MQLQYLWIFHNSKKDYNEIPFRFVRWVHNNMEWDYVCSNHLQRKVDALEEDDDVDDDMAVCC